MGTTASSPSPLAPAFQRMSSWDLKAARRLLQDYKDKDLDFGLNAQALSELVNGDKQWAENIIDAFGSTNGIVNALAFICGACFVSAGSALEKASLVFDAMDFDSTEQISMDEMTIVFLCCCRGLCVMAGVGAVPTDETLETVTLQAYRDYSKSSAQSISKAEFTDWVIKFASGSHCSGGGSAKEVSLQAAMEQFGVVSAQSQHVFPEDIGIQGSENNLQATEHEVTAEISVIDSNDVPLARDGGDKDGSGEYAVEAEQFESAEQYGEPAEQFDGDQQHDDPAQQFYGHEQHQQEEDGTHDQDQVADSSRGVYYDEEYDAVVDEDPGDSIENHESPIEDHPSGEPEIVAPAETLSTSDVGVHGEDVDPPVDSDTVPAAPSRPQSASDALIDDVSDSEAQDDADGANSFMSDTVEPSVKDAAIAADGEIVASDEPVLLDADRDENNNNDDAYDEEFAQEESTQEESLSARNEEGGHSAQHEEETTKERVDSVVDTPNEDVGVDPVSTEEDQDQEITAPGAALDENEAGDSSEPPQADPVDIADHPTAIDSHEQDKVANELDEKQQGDSGTAEQILRDGDVDLNAFDTYDYEDAAYDGSSGLLPPDPIVEDDSEAPVPLEADQAAEPASLLTSD